MARPESVAVGGYFPTPQHLIPLIKGYVTIESGARFIFVDPCAGEGAAIWGLYDCFGKGPTVYTCEMEATRHAILRERAQKEEWMSAQRALHGDAFRIEVNKGWAGLLLLNPPYDIDPVHGRLEQKFLDRFTPALKDEGVLIFIVPFTALAASALTLALEYENVTCYRFPKDDFAAFKQVVVFAEKTDRRLAPDPDILARVHGWAESVKGCPVLGVAAEPYVIPASYDGLADWKLREFDLQGLLKKSRPWRQSNAKTAGALTAVAHIMPEMPVEDLLFRTFPIATAPRPAHIAAGIASGLFNGREVTSKTKGMAPLLVKGVFDRDYITVQENVDKNGQTTSVTQIQQPRLVTTVLNLKTKQYSTLAPFGAPKSAGMNIEGLLEHYGPSLMHVMNQQCPVIYDPKRDGRKLPLALIARALFEAQGHAAKALLKLFGGPGLTRRQRRGKGAILLGEVGCGKTSCALSLGPVIGRSMLAVCPPHALADWENEAHTLLPNAEVRVLTSMQDVDDLTDLPTDRFLVAVLSRETAKLGHGWEAVSGPGCPKCGAPLPEGDLAKKRARCTAKPLTLGNSLARAAYSLALRYAPCRPTDGNVRALLEGRHLSRYVARLEERGKAQWRGFDSKWVLSTLSTVTQRLMKTYDERLAVLLGKLLLADYKPERIASLARTFSGSKPDYRMASLAQALSCLLPFGSDLQRDVQAHVYARDGGFSSGSCSADLKALEGIGLTHTPFGRIKLVDGQVQIDEFEQGSAELADAILSKLCTVGHFPRPEKECGEPLYQAVSGAVRFPVAEYIAKRHSEKFDFLVLDEGHEFQNGDTAQSHAAHRLSGLGIPTLLMTGSIMNGYAASLFTNMWALSADFRAEFKRDELQQYINRYGYLKRVLTDKDRETGEVVAFGSHTDRVERSERAVGNAPGILPLFLFRHLLKISVTLHKADLAINIPKCHHIREEIEPSAKQLTNYNRLVRALSAQIKKDQFSETLSGKLFGALSELPSYLDRATLDTGNQDDGSYGIYYPQSVGGGLVAKAESFSAKTILPKEQWMLDKVRAEIAEGRNVMVFCSHVNLLPRLARLLEKELGATVPVLYSDKVPTAKRKAWIDDNIIAKGARAMVVNPAGIQTALNNLRYFATEIWMEDPACNPILYRQAIGRVDRIAQKLETRIYTAIYAKTLQVQINQLLLRKVAVSIATDGLDSESALLAAGAGQDALLTGLSIGRQLWAMISDAA